MSEFDSYLDYALSREYPPAPKEMAPTQSKDFGSITPIPQTKFESLLEKTGMTLEQMGNELDKLGKLNIGGVEIGIRDFLPFVGTVEDGKVTGTPAALQQLGRGESIKGKPQVSSVIGPDGNTYYGSSGSPTMLNPDASAAVMDIATAGVVKPAFQAGKKAVKAVGKSLPKDLPVGMSIKMLDGTDEVIKQAPKIETPEFKNWFGKSKVVDGDGKPVVLYHGTDQNFDEFQGTSWFTTSKSDASNYSEIITPGKERTPNVMPVYVSIKKPKVIDSYATRDEVEAAKQSGKYDGVIVKGVMGSDKNYYITFKPEQVKSVFNRGTFDPKDPNILRGAGAATAGATATQEESK